MVTDSGPFVLGIGGTDSVNSATAKTLRFALSSAKAAGASTALFGGADIASLPTYSPGDTSRSGVVVDLLQLAREADALILASPGYHGGVGGAFKNAIDYLEDLREDARPYLTGRAVGCIAVAAGWQAAVATLTALRSTVHALRAWPTPLGVAVNSAGPVFDAEGDCRDERLSFQLRAIGIQVVEFARMQRGAEKPV